jgi:hemerythrin superfamily protein
MEIYTYLKKDHRKVSMLFKKLLAAKTNSIRKTHQDKIIHELLIHAASEQETFYKKLKKYDKSKECAKHGVQEHNDIINCIKKLIKQEIGSTKWTLAVRQMKKTVDHHVAEEEGPMFRKAKQVLTKAEANALTTQMDTLKKRLKRELGIKPARRKPGTRPSTLKSKRKPPARKKAAKSAPRKTARRA